MIGFDKSWEVFQQGKGLRPVDYVEQRIPLDGCWGEGSPEMADFEERIIFSKSTDWEYEHESLTQ